LIALLKQLSGAEIVAIIASVCVFILQAIKYTQPVDKTKDRWISGLTALFAIVGLIATYISSVQNKNNAEYKELQVAKKQAEAIAKIEQTHSNYLRTIISRDERTREQMRRTYDENQLILGYQYANNMHHQRELLGIISNRKLEDFIAEKIPKDLSFNEGKRLVSKAIKKYVIDSLHWDSNKMVRDSLGVLSCESENNSQLKVNYTYKTDKSRIYWDAYNYEREGPTREIYISVIIDNKKYSDTSLGTIDPKVIDLYYQYRNWFDQTKPSGQITMSRPEHHILFIVDDLNQFTPELLEESMDYSMSFELPLFILRGDNRCKISIYKMSDLTGIETLED